MSTNVVYSTVTKGHGDLTAAADHRRKIAAMVRAANRMPCAVCPTTGRCSHALDDSGLWGVK